VDDLLLLLHFHWARDTSTFPTERHRVQFAFILLLLSGTGCRPAELVDATKKRKEGARLGDKDHEAVDDNILAADKSDDNFGTGRNKDVDGRDENNLTGISEGGVEKDARRFNALCYEDVRLLVVRSPNSGERDVLAMEVTLAHHKGHKKRPKP